MTSQRSLWPREHGAYFQLALPLVVACARRWPTPAMLALATAAVLGFLAHEPWLVALGHRGARLRLTDGARARARAALLVCTAISAGAVGLALGPAHTLRAVALVAVPAAITLGFAWRRAEHTLTGELFAAIALTGAALPIDVAAGATLTAALARWAAWALGFGADIIAVHVVLARRRRRIALSDLLAAAALVAATIVTGERGDLAPAAPLTALGALLIILAPPPTRLRAIGIAIGATASVAGLLALCW